MASQPNLPTIILSATEQSDLKSLRNALRDHCKKLAETICTAQKSLTLKTQQLQTLEALCSRFVVE